MATGKQALRAFMGLPPVGAAPKEKKADFQRLSAWAAKQPDPLALTVADFKAFNGTPYKPPPPQLEGEPSAKKAKIMGGANTKANTNTIVDDGSKMVIKDVIDILDPVSTYERPEALDADELAKAAKSLVRSATELEKAYKTAGAKALAEIINKNVALATAMGELI